MVQSSLGALQRAFKCVKLHSGASALERLVAILFVAWWRYESLQRYSAPPKSAVHNFPIRCMIAIERSYMICVSISSLYIYIELWI